MVTRVGEATHSRHARPPRALTLVCALAPLLEVAIVGSVGPRNALALAPQLTAPPTLDVFHDLRWIAVYHYSWATLTLELVAMIVLRSAFSAWIVSLAGGDEHPRFGAALARTTPFYALTTVLMIPWVVLIFGFGIIGLSYLYFVALPAMLALGLIVHRGAAAHASGRMWQWRPTWRSCGWLAAAFVWLTAAGALALAAPLAGTAVISVAAGALNARASWSIAVDVLAMPKTARKRQVLVPVGIATVLAVVVFGAAAGFAAGDARPTDHRRVKIPARAEGHPVLVASGFGTRWRGTRQLRLPNEFVEWRYSYRGLDPSGRVLPFDPRDTLRPMQSLVTAMRDEVRALNHAYSSPVTIVAESEGALVARAYLLSSSENAATVVDRLITLDMPRVGDAVYYPPAGESGWGLASGWGLRGLTAVVGDIGFLTVSADAPFFRSLVGCPALLATIGTAPLPRGVSETRVIALADAVDDYAHDPRVDSYVVRSPHGGLLGRPDVQRLIADTVSGVARPASATSLSVVRVIGSMSAAWSLPGLKRGLVPADSC